MLNSKIYKHEPENESIAVCSYKGVLHISSNEQCRSTIVKMDTFKYMILRKSGIFIMAITICNIYVKLKRMQNCSKFRNSRCIYRTKEGKLHRGPQLYLQSLCFFFLKKKEKMLCNEKSVCGCMCIHVNIFIYFFVYLKFHNKIDLKK